MLFLTNLFNNYYPKNWKVVPFFFKNVHLFPNIKEIKNNYDIKDIIPMEKPITLGDRMKNYEVKNEHKINAYDHFIIRLDGKCFSAFTKKCKKPFDETFVKAMALTTKDLIEYFEAQTGYTHSDEITLIFNAKCSLKDYEDNTKLRIEHNYNGRIEKTLSLISSYCSVRFNFHIHKLFIENPTKINTDYNESFINLIKEFQQIFDARILIFNEENKHEILNHQIWRVRDCTRNCILTYGHTYLGKKNIMGKKTNELIDMLKEIEIYIEDIPFYLKYGLYCKKVQVEKIVDGKNYSRTEFIFAQLEIMYSEENINMLLDKYWTNTTNLNMHKIDPLV